MSGSATSTAKVRLSIPEGVDPTRVTGPADALLRAAERRCEASVTVRGERRLAEWRTRRG
mgnify:CR=1 FL=1